MWSTPPTRTGCSARRPGAFEICDRLERAPDYHIIPVGNAGNITSYWRGYNEYFNDGITDNLPQMFGFQAAGSAPDSARPPRGPAQDDRDGDSYRPPRLVGGGADCGQGFRRRDPLGNRQGDPRGLPDDCAEGVFAELASSAPVAGLLQLSNEGRLEKGKTVVCILTGHGLKDPSWAISGAPKPMQVEAEIDAVAQALGF